MPGITKETFKKISTYDKTYVLLVIFEKLDLNFRLLKRNLKAQ